MAEGYSRCLVRQLQHVVIDDSNLDPIWWLTQAEKEPAKSSRPNLHPGVRRLEES